MKKLHLICAICSAMTFSSLASASLVSGDWKAVGDNLITADNVSGLNWLDLTQSNNMSFNYVLSQLGAGGLFEGFRVATTSEVISFWSQPELGYTFNTTHTNTEINGYPSQVVYNAAALLGNIKYEENPAQQYIGAVGLVAEGSTANTRYQYGVWHKTSSTVRRNYIENGGLEQGVTSTNLGFGTYLVSASPSAVPVPAAVWLFSSGLLGLIGVAKRKKA